MAEPFTTESSDIKALFDIMKKGYINHPITQYIIKGIDQAQKRMTDVVFRFHVMLRSMEKAIKFRFLIKELYLCFLFMT